MSLAETTPKLARVVVYPETFPQFLRGNLTKEEYAYPVFSKLGWTKTRLTRYENDPESMTFKHLLELAVFLTGDRRNAVQLVERYKCGAAKITINEKQVLTTYKNELP